MGKEVEVTCICPDLKRLSSDNLKELIVKARGEIIVFPEYLLELVDRPKIKSDKLIIWGSKIKKNKNQLYIQNKNEKLNYSKMCLTPWEKELRAGEELLVFEFKKMKVAVLICFEVEFPKLSKKLKKEDIDLLIVPAATESRLGYERVSRCASSRAIELGCAVVTCHLIGRSDNELIDENVGNHNLYLPAQSLFNGFQRMYENPLLEYGEVVHNFLIPIQRLRAQKEIFDETNPAL